MPSMEDYVLGILINIIDANGVKAREVVMRDAACVSNCMLTSLRRLISEHLSIILAAGVVGLLFGLFFGGTMGALSGAGVGISLAIAYGCIPRMADCVGTCPLQ
jgi:hypothetical protein